jgi:hypothetical protein
MPLARTFAAVTMLAIVGAAVWMGWQFSAPPIATERARASTVEPAMMNAAPAPAEPTVFATRVLRSDPRPPAPPRAPAETAAAPASSTHAAPRADP